MNRALDEIERQIADIEVELARLDAERDRLIEKLRGLRAERAARFEEHGIKRRSAGKQSKGAPTLFEVRETSPGYPMQTPPEKARGRNATDDSPARDKINLFMHLFAGKEDIYARRFESRKTGKSGYAPVCRNEWVEGVCKKPKIPCRTCAHRAFEPVTPLVIRNHLLGRDPDDASRRDFTMGVYPMRLDETCRFLAVDFDKSTWRDDATAFIETCRRYIVPAALERSRSGNGGHVWIFFSEPVPAALARRMGSYILTRTMERRPEIGMESYDRFFPSQDTLPDGGFGNLIALPLQRKPRSAGNSVFIDADFKPHPDQWAFLSSIKQMSLRDVEAIVVEAPSDDEVLAVRNPPADDALLKPWTAPPSRRPKSDRIPGPLPDGLHVVLANQIVIPKKELPPPLRNRLIRLAAFQNPEFYRAQSMRMPTFGKPRIICCAEDYPEHIALPRGCLDDLSDLLKDHDIELTVDDQRNAGRPLEATSARSAAANGHRPGRWMSRRFRVWSERASSTTLSPTTGIFSWTNATTSRR